MTKYRKRPIIVEAKQWPGFTEKNQDQCILIEAWIESNGGSCWLLDSSMIIKTLEGDHEARANDWIIKGVAGEFYPCKPDIFEKTYELVGV